MMKKITALLLILLLFTVSGCAREEKTIYLCTDLHYFSHDLHDDGPLFNRMLKTITMLTEYTPEILDEFTNKVIEDHPDYLICAGDITFNGELVDLKQVAERFAKIEEAGIPVLAIPGNHDILYYHSAGYDNEEYYETPAITPEDYLNVMGDFGYNDALYRCEESFTYVYPINDQCWALMMDTNFPGTRGTLDGDTYQWIKEILEIAKDQKKEVFTVTHQPLLPQNSRMALGYTIYNSEQVLTLLKSYDIKYNFSGHVHIQHMVSNGDITDIATGSMAVLNLNYGVIEVSDKDIKYHFETQEKYSDLANKRFDDLTREQISELVKSAFKPEDQQRVSQFMIEINNLYFSGALTKEYVDEHKELIDLITTTVEKSWGSYIASMTEGLE